MTTESHDGWKAKAIHEFKAFWIIAIYLFMFLGLFTIYRRLVIAEVGSAYLHYGIALIQALVIAKIVLVGQMFSFTRKHDDKALIWPILYKTLLFALMVIAFGVVERLVEAWIHHEGIRGAVDKIVSMGIDEFAARMLLLVFSFIPFFAFGELGRVLGMNRLVGLFFSRDAVRAERESRVS
ncbi:MAG: hypothetical protein U1F54_20055 [Burkholderiales bacterium]